MVDHSLPDVKAVADYSMIKWQHLTGACLSMVSAFLNITPEKRRVGDGKKGSF